MTTEFTTTDEIVLKDLLQKHHNEVLDNLLPEELNILLKSFLPWHSSSIRAQSLLFLSKFSSDIRQKYITKSDSEIATSVIVRIFAAPTEARLADTHEPSTLAALSFLAALFQVDWASASSILARDGVLDSVLETPDIYPSSKDIPLAVANLLSQASGHQQCRSLLAVPSILSWLEKSAKQATDQNLRAAAAVALVKLSRGADIDSQSNGLAGISTASSGQQSQGRSIGADDNLFSLMKELVITNEPSSSSMLDAVEGLAYLTTQPNFKEIVSSDPILLKRLIALIPRRHPASSFPASHAESITEPKTGQEVGLAMGYGIAAIILNLCGYKPQLSEEERQIEKLRRMTKEPAQDGRLSSSVAGDSVDSESLDDNDHVRARGQKLIQAGVVDALTGIIKGLGSSSGGNRSIAVQLTVAKAFLSLAEEKHNRGKILQGGGPKTLLTIISSSLGEMRHASGDGQRSIDKLDASHLLAIQALAKLSITSPPPAVFGPAQDSYVDAIRPFALLLCHSSASLLQRFEAMMALTNITSISPDAAERVSVFRFFSGKGNSLSIVGDIATRAETSLLDGHTMLRRAATELVCNLVGGSESSFDYFSGATGMNAKTRLQILAALADVEDLQTRLAASGALAILTASPAACQNLLKLETERRRVLPVLVGLISPEIAREYREELSDDEVEEVEVPVQDGDDDASDPGLVHRGVVCVRNVFTNLDANGDRKLMFQPPGTLFLARALVQVIKSSRGGPTDGAVLTPAAEVLKWLVETGVKLPL